MDTKNPRFGGNLASNSTQKNILNTIVEQHGVNDLLSSMTANGYFTAEPVVVIRENNGLTVVEGNRHLAATLILTGDARAVQFHTLADKWAVNALSDKAESLKTLPVSVFDSRLNFIGFFETESGLRR